MKCASTRPLCVRRTITGWIDRNHSRDYSQQYDSTQKGRENGRLSFRSVTYRMDPLEIVGASAHVPPATVFVRSETRGQRILNTQDGYGMYTAAGSHRFLSCRSRPVRQ
jgi:hypothetical protein